MSTTIKPKARKAINAAIVGAAGIAAVPIPFSDAALLVPLQMAMIARIYKAYDKNLTDGFKEGVAQATIASTLGKMLVGNAFKFIPGVGTIAGGAINMTVAVAITKLIGTNVAKGLETGKIQSNQDLLDIVASLTTFLKK